MTKCALCYSQCHLQRYRYTNRCIEGMEGKTTYICRCMYVYIHIYISLHARRIFVNYNRTERASTNKWTYVVRTCCRPTNTCLPPFYHSTVCTTKSFIPGAMHGLFAIRCYISSFASCVLHLCNFPCRTCSTSDRQQRDGLHTMPCHAMPWHNTAGTSLPLCLFASSTIGEQVYVYLYVYTTYIRVVARGGYWLLHKNWYQVQLRTTQ